jgi:TPR repeat protein
MRVFNGLVLAFLLFSLAYGSNFRNGVQAFKQKDFVTARKYFELALRQDGVKNANYFLGVIYLKGYGVEQDLEKAQGYLLAAAKQGNMRARCYLAEIYILKDKDLSKAKPLLKEGEESGARECAHIIQKYQIKM